MHSYTNTNCILALWKDLTKLFQKQVELLKIYIFGEVMIEVINWPLRNQYMATWHDGDFDVIMTSLEVVCTHYHICGFLRRYLLLKIKPNTGQTLGTTDKRERRKIWLSLMVEETALIFGGINIKIRADVSFLPSIHSSRAQKLHMCLNSSSLF